ncbi:MAG: EAL domain-containing protein [Actinomycetota bacterium]
MTAARPDDSLRPGGRRNGRALNPFAGFRDAISDEEARNPAVVTELQRRFRQTILFATLGTIPTAICVGALMWLVSPDPGVLLWVAASLTTLGTWLWALRLPVDLAWIRLAAAIQIYGGVVWGSLPVVAMPGDERWQLFMAAFGMGVQASSVLFAAQIRRLFYSFHIPNLLLSLTGFLLHSDGVGRWGAALLAYAGIFAAGLSEIHHLTALSASTFSVRSSRLAVGLTAKSQALTEANQQLAAQASTDPLTALSNRFDFDRRLDAALADQVTGSAPVTVVAVAMIDLDRFKAINDSLGHRVGDLLLVAVGERLRHRLVDDEVLARFGGDELVVLSPTADPESGAADLGRRLAMAFDDPFVIEDRRLDVGASIGVADSSSADQPGDLLRFADAALYRGKRQGGNQVEVFDAELHRALRERRQLEDELAAALGDGQLVPFLQPFVDVQTGAIVGAEALVRWIHPDGIRSAGSFIDVVEDLRLVDELTDRLLDTLTEARMLNPAITQLPISINVAPDQLDGLIDRYEGTGVLAGLKLEITEQARFVESVTAVNRLIGRAHANGAMVLLDDFGVGFSSLARAARLAVDGYKLDRLFVAELSTCPDARAVLAGVAVIAERQGRELIAEGVESHDQTRILAEYGVTTAQGFVYSPAVPLTELGAMVARDHRFPAAIDRSVPERS